LAIDAASADADQMRLPFDRDGMGAINYRFALSNPSERVISKKHFPALIARSWRAVP